MARLCPMLQGISIQARSEDVTRVPRRPVATVTLAVAALMTVFGAAGAGQLCLADEPTGIINVKNLKAADPQQTVSAVGDGKTDDTAALQAAAALAKKRTNAFKPDDGSYLGTSPAIYFPAGRYLISDEIELGPYTNIISDSRAIIEQKSPEKRCLVFTPAFTISVRGLRFLGGKNQIYVENKNIDGTMIDISECEFQLSSDYAIMTQGTTSDADQHMSANLMITKCKFIRPRKVLRNVCDYAMVRDSWITLHKDNFDRDSAAFLNTSGSLMFDNMIGVPVFGSTDAQGKKNLENDGIDHVRWVDNHGNFTATKSRFGGEFGGIPIVHHFGLPGQKNALMGQSVCIENSMICAGPRGRNDSAVVTLRGGIPQLLRLVGNQQLIDGRYVLVEGPGVDSILKEKPDARKRIHFEIEANMAWPEPALGREFDEFRIRKEPNNRNR